MKGTIYCIKEKSTDKVIYIGSTTKYLANRKGVHLMNCYKYNKDFPIYEYMRSVCPDRNDFSNYFSFEILKTVTVTERKELLELENLYIQKNEDLLNKRKATLTKEEFKHYHQKWYENNREHWRQYLNEYRRKKKLLQQK